MKDFRTKKEVFENNQLTSETRIATICRDYPKLDTLLLKSAQVFEDYCIKDHIHLVLEQFESQKKFTDWEPLEKQLKLSQTYAQGLFRAIILMHDIGKALGPKNKQHELTLPLLQFYLKQWDYGNKEINLAEALVNHDWLGKTLKQQITLKTFLEEIARLAQRAKLSVKDYFSYQWLFYICDASSYPSLRKKIFAQDHAGRLFVRSGLALRIQEQMSQISI